MSMHTYPLCSDLCFVVDEHVAPYLVLAHDKQNNQVPSEIQALLDAGTFHRAAASTYPNSLKEVLDAAEYSDIAMAYEVSDELHLALYYGQFEGEILYLNEDGFTSFRSEEMADDFICFYEPAKASTPFKAAYGSMREFIHEVKSVFEPLGVFPKDFDWLAHIASFSGTTCC